MTARRPCWAAGLAVTWMFCGIAACATASDWPRFRGPSGQGLSTDRGLPLTWAPDRNILWKVELPGAGTSSPVVFGERIFLTCYSGYNVPGQVKGRIEDLRRHVVCLERTTGKLLWSREVRSRLPEQETIREDHGYATSTPVVDADGVYAFFGVSGVVAFDHAGNQRWHADVGTNHGGWGSAASLNRHGNRVLVNASVESESLVALHHRTGAEVWRVRGIKESWNLPLPVQVHGQTEIVLAMAHKVLGIDPASGNTLWSYSTNNHWYMVPSLVAQDGIVYCTGGRTGYFSALRAGGRGDVTRSHELWTGKKGSNVTSPVLHDGHLYWMSDQLGIAYCAEAKTGRIVYEERLGAGQVYASPVLAEGRLYYTDRGGRTFVLAAQPQFKLLATNHLGPRLRVDASPAVTGGRLLLRTDRHLYCIGEDR